MKKTLFGLTALGLLVAGTAYAGQKWPTFPNGNVNIDQTNRTAYGWISGARNSTNTNERISCEVYGSSGGWRGAVCSFSDDRNNNALCSTTDPNLVDAIKFVQSDSYLWVAWDTSSRCTSVSTYTDSAYAPKAP